MKIKNRNDPTKNRKQTNNDKKKHIKFISLTLSTTLFIHLFVLILITWFSFHFFHFESNEIHMEKREKTNKQTTNLISFIHSFINRRLSFIYYIIIFSRLSLLLS